MGPFRARAVVVSTKYRQHILEAEGYGEILRVLPFVVDSDEDRFSAAFLRMAVTAANGGTAGHLACRYQHVVAEDGAHHQHFVSDGDGKPLFRTEYMEIGSAANRRTREFLQRAVATLNGAAPSRTGKGS